MTFKNVQDPVAVYALADGTSGKGPIEPVCRMRVSNPVARVERDGHTFVFCSEHCASTFRNRR